MSLLCEDTCERMVKERVGRGAQVFVARKVVYQGVKRGSASTDDVFAFVNCNLQGSSHLSWLETICQEAYIEIEL